MTRHSFTALIPVTATGQNQDDAREYARGLLDDTLARLDEQHPAGNLSTGPAILIDPVSLRQLATLIRDDANSLATGAALTRTVPAARIRQRAEQILAALDQAAAGGRPDWWCAHHGEDGVNTDKEPWCHGCVEAGITTAPGSAD